MNIVIELFLTFFKIGLFTFGGGYAMIPLIENNCVEKKKWITHDEMMNITVIAESTPGPIAINCATYVGYKRAGIIGAMFSTFGVVLPSFTIILLISMVLDGFLEIEVVANAFKGIKIAVGILIADAGWTMIQKMPKEQVGSNLLPRIIMLISFCIMMAVNIFSLHFSSISLIIICALFTLVVFMVQNISKKKGA